MSAKRKSTTNHKRVSHVEITGDQARPQEIDACSGGAELESLTPTASNPTIVQSPPDALSTKCTRCGKCCTEEVCTIGILAFGEIDAPCPALIPDGAVFACAFVKAEKEFGMESILRDALAIGVGCDCAR